jgi:hypothetical protein
MSLTAASGRQFGAKRQLRALALCVTTRGAVVTAYPEALRQKIAATSAVDPCMGVLRVHRPGRVTGPAEHESVRAIARNRT